MSKPNPLSHYELQALAAQLACPSGEQAAQVGDAMANGNRTMIHHAIDHLQLQAGQHVLEIGHGGADHLDYLFAQQPDLHYSGLERSPAMHQRGEQQQYANGRFYLYDGDHLPEFPQPFARLFSVNTLYFWPQPTDFLNALSDTLTADALVCLTYGCKDFMTSLPFSRYGFTLYDEADIERLVAQTLFTVRAHHYASDHVISKSGEPVDRKFCTTVLHKA